MMPTAGGDEVAAWLASAPGRYMLAWEQSRIDQAVVDLFGFHAVQLGFPAIDALRSNRMPHRWLAGDHAAALQAAGAGPDAKSAATTPAPVALRCDFDALPFPDHSLDLVVLPHTLEFARDPHQTLREVDRVLVPEGRVVIFGLNPASLWGLRQRVGRLRGPRVPTFLPRGGEFIGYWRLRDWLRLLSFEVEGGRFGCYAPPLGSARWLQRFEWMDRLGDRWWPVFGAVYSLVAVKRVRGMRLVGLVRDLRRRPQVAPAVVANRRRSEIERAETEEAS
jgi:SAM-dependent methyltransferase